MNFELRPYSNLFRNQLDRLGRIGTLLQISLIPLCVSPIHQSPYILPKQALAIWIALALLFPLLFIRMLLFPSPRYKGIGFDLPALVLGLWMGFSSLFSVRLVHSIDLLLLYLAAWITWKSAFVFFDSKKSRMMALWVLFGSAILGCLWVWKQALDGTALPHGTFGNKNFESQYLILPLACFMPFALRNFTGNFEHRRWWAGSAALLLFLIATLIRLQSMGAILGMLLAGFAVCFCFQLRKRWTWILNRTQGTLLILFFVLLALGVGIRLFSPDLDLKSKAAQLLSEDSVRVRLELWKGCWPLIKDHWLHGVGPGNFQRVYPLYRLESEMVVLGRNSTVSHAHNCYIEWTAELGLIGLFLLVWLVHRITDRLMNFLTAADGYSWYLGLGILGALVATDGHCFFSSNLYQAGPVIALGFLLGLMESLIMDFQQDQSETQMECLYPLRPRMYQMVIISGIALFFSLVMTGLLIDPVFRPSISDIQVRSGIEAKNINQWELAAKYFEEATLSSPNSFEAPYYRSLLALEQGHPQTSLEYANRALRIQPDNFDAMLYRGLALENRDRLDEAAEAYRQVLRLFPLHGIAQEGLRRVNAKMDARLEKLSSPSETL